MTSVYKITYENDIESYIDRLVLHLSATNIATGKELNELMQMSGKSAVSIPLEMLVKFLKNNYPEEYQTSESVYRYTWHSDTKGFFEAVAKDTIYEIAISRYEMHHKQLDAAN